jgi:type II secretory pathway pseudopilin PulG
MKKLYKKDGLTLVESIVAVCIFGIAIAGICALLVSARELNDRARLHYTAINIAKNRLEKARTLNFSTLSLFQENGTIVDYNGNPDPNGAFRRTTVISNVATNLVEIIITVDIRNRVTLGFTGEQETLRSYLTEYIVPP